MSEPLRVGLVGFGNRGENAAHGLAAAPSVDFRAVADLHEDHLDVARETFDVETYSEAEEMFADADVEAVVVVTQASAHASVSIAAMEAGLDVLCEKPLADTVADAREMVAAERRTSQRGAIHFQNRYNPFYWTLHELAPDLDPLQMLFTYHRGIFRKRYLRPGYAYGILDGAIHRIDLANWIVGRTPTAVSASLGHGVYSPNETLDAATIRIEYVGGGTATIQASMGGPGLDNVCYLVGKRGNVQRDDGAVVVNEVSHGEKKGSRRVELLSSSGYPDSPPAKASAEGVALKEAFAARVRGNENAPVATFEDGLEALLVAKASVESDQKGETVYLTDLREEQPSV